MLNAGSPPGRGTMDVPMTISDEAIREFRAIVRKEYGMDITDEDARIAGERLLTLYELIYRPLPSEIAAAHPSATAAPHPASEAHDSTRPTADTSGPDYPIKCEGR